ncbi:ABC transporter permease subunit [Candidatus Rariloculus sp.]|uniref:ABC transporter permease n=1 Tax=Candidatus Rariloculus sp. TaxID=3101265 RepID=UPI003D0F8F55
MSTAAFGFKPRDFDRVATERRTQTISRPSVSYWQDAWRRLKANRRALISLYIVIALALFTLAGPLLWRVDPAAQDLDQVSQPPGLPQMAVIVDPYVPWPGVTAAPPAEAAQTPAAAGPAALRLVEPATTQAVRIAWDPGPGAAGYQVYRNIYDPEPDGALGLPVAEILDPAQVSFEDRLDLEPVPYWYSVVALDASGAEADGYTTLRVDTTRVISAAEAEALGWIDDASTLAPGDELVLPYHPLGTDYLGRDMLARLMYGARVSLFIGVVAPLLFVVAGIVYGSAAGFIGGRVDQILMRFADFVVALPFLLFMILFKVAFGIGPGESGVLPMLVALVLLAWPATARLVRGQVLQIREEGYIGASQLLGARTGYLVLRHMIPNTMGVILVTLTFAVPSVIFTEAFLSFIGMGVAPPTPSWGSMSNEGLRTMLTHPHELVFPAIFISVTVLAFNLLGDGLRDALDVRMRGTE